jgi:hypothetical protein
MKQMTQMTQQDAFNTIKKVIDLALQNGLIKSLEDSKVVYDSVSSIYQLVTNEMSKPKEVASQLNKVEPELEITKL